MLIINTAFWIQLNSSSVGVLHADAKMAAVADGYYYPFALSLEFEYQNFRKVFFALFKRRKIICKSFLENTGLPIKEIVQA